MEIATFFPCWCGNSRLTPFSSGYWQCPECKTLISRRYSKLDGPKIADDKNDFYGKDYWFSHQEKDLGYANIMVRAKLDLPERCLHWLRALLKYRLPPGEVLELGSMHGGFVALLNWAGFSATGLDLSPWVAQFARETFHAPTLLGPIEEQALEPETFDVIAMMDVLEHFPDPTRTMKHCLTLIKKNGLLVIQTPHFPEDRNYESMVAQGDRFLEHLKDNEHLFLFSQRSIREFFHRLGTDHLIFETPIFSHYDMFLIVSRSPISLASSAEMEERLSKTPQGRLVQALLNLQTQIGGLRGALQTCENDRAARLQVIRNFEQSLSWRITAPLRSVRARWVRYFRKT
jgi:2-polyprenyl-3-methyl-5-hydroxy-6-metoxy-1,4-benzoquinol methylase